jgi:hypothetical protein
MRQFVNQGIQQCDRLRSVAHVRPQSSRRDTREVQQRMLDSGHRSQYTDRSTKVLMTPQVHNIRY